MVASHGQALLKSGDHIGMVSGDLRDPASMLRHPGVLSLLDLAQPLAVLCTGTLHFVADQAGPHKIIAEYRDQLAPGSYLAITHGTLADDPAREGQAAERVYRRRPPSCTSGRCLTCCASSRASSSSSRAHLDHEMAAPAGIRTHRAAALHARRPRPQALADELVVDAAFGSGQRVAGAAPAELDQLGGDRDRGLLRRPGP